MPAPTRLKSANLILGEEVTTSFGGTQREGLRRVWGQRKAAEQVEKRARETVSERSKKAQEFFKRVEEVSRVKVQESVSRAAQASTTAAMAQMTTLLGTTAAGMGGMVPGAPGGSIAKIAQSQVGAPYVWAASNPKGPAGGPGSAFDCSGFTQWVLGQAGISVPHMASQQQKVLPKVGRANLQAGDLLFFNFGRKAPGIADHVGIYLGNGMMIDASSSAGHILIRPVFWSAFIGGGAVRPKGY